MSKRRVVVTGMGIISPLGLDLASNWDGICNGRSGISMVEGFDAATYPTRIAGEIRGFDITQWVNPKDAKKMERCRPGGHRGQCRAHRRADWCGHRRDLGYRRNRDQIA